LLNDSTRKYEEVVFKSRNTQSGQILSEWGFIKEKALVRMHRGFFFVAEGGLEPQNCPSFERQR
jgi:hypothetical protein